MKHRIRRMSHIEPKALRAAWRLEEKQIVAERERVRLEAKARDAARILRERDHAHGLAMEAKERERSLAWAARDFT
jgi:hypothetical protein